MKYVDEQAFPAVSICNLNDLRVSKLNGSVLYKLLEAKKHKGGGLNLSQITGEEYRNTTMEACHRIQHMLVQCNMLGVKCSHEDFVKFNQKQVKVEKYCSSKICLEIGEK